MFKLLFQYRCLILFCSFVVRVFFFPSVLCVLKSLFAVVFADVRGIGIMDILRRQCHVEVYA